MFAGKQVISPFEGGSHIYVGFLLIFKRSIVGDERAQPHTHSNQVQQEGHFLALLFAFVRLFGGEPVWTACHEHGATLTAAGAHETTEAMYRAQGQ